LVSTGQARSETRRKSGTDDSFGNRGSGIYVNNSSNNTIGGTTPEKRNVISGSFYEGVWIKGGSNNTVIGNLIGPDIGGTQDDGNFKNGVLIEDSSGNTVGGSIGTSPGAACTGACNVISGNNDNGVQVKGATSTNNNVSGNFIGTEKDGTGRRKNDDSGVLINGAPGNTVGGTTAAARNVISGNVISDVQIQAAGATGNVVRGNFIGTELTGAARIDAVFAAAFKGVVITGAPNNTIGGSANTTPSAGCAGACNVISGHLGDGIDINGAGATGNSIQGNYIGVDAQGAVAIANGNLQSCDGGGIWLTVRQQHHRRERRLERNLISGNAGRASRSARHVDNTSRAGQLHRHRQDGGLGTGTASTGSTSTPPKISRSAGQPGEET
jgi:titin